MYYISPYVHFPYEHKRNISQGRKKVEKIAQSPSNAMDRIRICILFCSVLTSKHKQQKDTEDDIHWKKSSTKELKIIIFNSLDLLILTTGKLSCRLHNLRRAGWYKFS